MKWLHKIMSKADFEVGIEAIPFGPIFIPVWVRVRGNREGRILMALIGLTLTFVVTMIALGIWNLVRMFA